MCVCVNVVCVCVRGGVFVDVGELVLNCDVIVVCVDVCVYEVCE